MSLSPPVPADEIFGNLNQDLLDMAEKLLNDKDRMAQIEKMLEGPGGDGVSAETRDTYQLAIAIATGQYRLTRTGWIVVT